MEDAGEPIVNRNIGIRRNKLEAENENEMLDDDGKKEESSAAMARPTSGSGADGLGADGETGRERRGGRQRR